MARSRDRDEEVNTFLNGDIHVPSKTIYFGFGDPDGDSELDHILAANTIKALHILDRVRPDDPIHLLINNQGGDDQHGLAVYDAIRQCKSPVHGIVLGHCQSMAVWVLQACDHRTMSPHSCMMIHDGSGALVGNKQEIDNWRKWQDKVDDVCRNILLTRIRERHPKFQRARLLRALRVDTILSAEQALEWGLIDEVLQLKE